jgi:hypothetical protein
MKIRPIAVVLLLAACVTVVLYRKSQSTSQVSPTNTPAVAVAETSFPGQRSVARPNDGLAVRAHAQPDSEARSGGASFVQEPRVEDNRISGQAEVSSIPPPQPAPIVGSDNVFPIRLDTQGRGGKVRLEGTSTHHSWQVEGNLIGGYLKVGPDFPPESVASQQQRIDAEANVFVVVRNLKSVDSHGSHLSAKMDEVIYERLKAQANPRIFYRLTELTLNETRKDPSATYVFDSKGELAIAGVTNTISMPVAIAPLGNKELRIEGATTVKMTDFDLDRDFLGGAMKAGDQVKVIFTWTVGQRATPATSK